MGFEIGKTIAGYEIVDVLGTSKTGVAYKVRNMFAQRFEVLKILPKSIQDDEEQNARFLREIKVHAQLLHPNIVTFYNAREIEGQLVMTKEFVPGVTLAEKLRAGAIPGREASRYACHALSALEYAHAHSIIHRGLSSSNLIITDEGIARLNGFGFAKSVTDPELTAAGVVIGTLKYMSPEQVKGDAADARSDIYSLGIVLYEMLVGKVPFEAKSQFEVMMAQVNTAPKHASDVNPSVSRELGDAVARALAKPPEERFQTAREFRNAIERIELSQIAPVAALKSPVPAAEEVRQPAAERVPLPESAASTPLAPLPDSWAIEQTEPSHVDPVAASKSPLPAAEEVREPVAERAPLPESPAPAPLGPLPDAWAIESALEVAESKLASVELKCTEPVAERPAVVETPASSQSSTFSDLWRTRFQPEPVPKPAAVDIADLAEAPVELQPSTPPHTLAPNLAFDSPTPDKTDEHDEFDSWPSARAHSETPLEPVQSVIENDAPVETSAIAAVDALPDGLTIESAVVWVESKPGSPDLMSQHEPEPRAAEIPATPAELPAPVPDWWTLKSEVTSAETTPAAPPVEFESSTPIVSTLSIAGTPVTPTPSAASELSAQWPPAVVESKPEAAQLDLLSSALEEPKSEANLAGTPASQPDPWATEATVAATESKHEPTALSSWFAQQPAQPSDRHDDYAAPPLSLWTSGPPDTWTSEPAGPSTPEPVSVSPLSAPVEAPAPPLESAALTEAPAAPPVPTPQAQVAESAQPAVDLSPQPVPEAPQSTAAATAAPGAPATVAPTPVVPTPAQANPDLLTALFGDTLLSRLSLTLVVCAITFFLGTVTLFAVLSVTKP